MITFIVIKKENGQITEMQLNLNYLNKPFKIPSDFGRISIDIQFADLCLNRRRRINGYVPIGCTSKDLIPLIFGYRFGLVCDIINLNPLDYPHPDALASKLQDTVSRFLEYMHFRRSYKKTDGIVGRTKPTNNPRAKIVCNIRGLYESWFESLMGKTSSGSSEGMPVKLAFQVCYPEVL